MPSQRLTGAFFPAESLWWPDADKSGQKAAIEVARRLHGIGTASVRLVSLPDGLPSGWDLGDPVPDEIDVNALLINATAFAPNDGRPRRRSDIHGESKENGPLGLLTEDSAALLFAARNARRLRFCHDTGGWFIWTEIHWELDEAGSVLNQIRNVVRDLTDEMSPRMRRAARRYAYTASVERFARIDPRLAVTANAWDRDPFLLGTPAGTVDLRTGQLRPAIWDRALYR
jgi:putative DNA primase/helicase